MLISHLTVCYVPKKIKVIGSVHILVTYLDLDTIGIIVYKGSTLDQMIIIFSTMTYPNAGLDLSRQQFSFNLFL